MKYGVNLEIMFSKWETDGNFIGKKENSLSCIASYEYKICVQSDSLALVNTLLIYGSTDSL